MISLGKVNIGLILKKERTPVKYEDIKTRIPILGRASIPSPVKRDPNISTSNGFCDG